MLHSADFQKPDVLLGFFVGGDGKSVIIFFCRQQNVEDFMDEDELELRQKSSVQTKAEYDTFGDTATELARKAAAADAHARPSLIPGPVFQDLIAPVPDSVGRTHISYMCTLQCGMWSQLRLSRKPGLKAQMNVVCNKIKLVGVLFEA